MSATLPSRCINRCIEMSKKEKLTRDINISELTYLQQKLRRVLRPFAGDLLHFTFAVQQEVFIMRQATYERTEIHDQFREYPSQQNWQKN